MWSAYSVGSIEGGGQGNTRTAPSGGSTEMVHSQFDVNAPGTARAP